MSLHKGSPRREGQNKSVNIYQIKMICKIQLLQLLYINLAEGLG